MNNLSSLFLISRTLLLFALLSCNNSKGSGNLPSANLPPQNVKETAPPKFSGSPVVYSGHFPKRPGFSSTRLNVAGLDRQVELYVPKNLRPKLPLLITFHGSSGLGIDWIDAPVDSDPQGLEDMAETKGFIIASPLARTWGEGQGDWDNHSGNDRYWETFPNVDPNKNPDLLLVKAIIQEAQKSYDIDAARIYVMGHSNGGYFATLTAMALRDQIAAFAESASGLVKCARGDDCQFQGTANSCSALRSQAPASCTSCNGPEKPVAIPPLPPSDKQRPAGYLAHGNRDDVVSVFYTCELANRMQALGYEVSVNIWDEKNVPKEDGWHAMAPNFIEGAWNFMAAHRLQ